MSYFATYIDSAGLHIPSYIDIRDKLLDDMKTIYGSDIYIDIDSQDYQMVSSFALMAYDTLQSVLLAYNNANPITAIGTGLDRIVAINGITRSEATVSFCDTVLITGIASTSIYNGIVQDANGYKWDLPSVVTIPVDGTVTVTATCEIEGAVQLPIGTLTTILTPISGWTSVTNTGLATVGKDLESDSVLKSRQSISGAVSSITVLDSIIAAILNLNGVTRAIPYENDTAATVNGYPAHSITIVVEGGTNADIANIIYWKKAPGVYTNGNTSVVVTGKYEQTNTIRFQRTSSVNAVIALSITKLASYNSAILTTIKDNLVEYINNLKIGEDLYISNLYAPIISASESYTSAPFYITALTVNLQATVVTVTDFQTLLATAANITITVT